MWNEIKDVLESGAYMQFFLFLGGLVLMRMLYKLQKSPRIDFVEMMIGEDGKASSSKIMQLGAYLVSTWGFVYLTVSNHLTEFYFTTYMIAWSGSAILSKWITSKVDIAAATPPPTVVTTPTQATINIEK